MAASAKHLKAHDEAHAQAAAALAEGHRKLCDKVEKVRTYASEMLGAGSCLGHRTYRARSLVQSNSALPA